MLKKYEFLHQIGGWNLFMKNHADVFFNYNSQMTLNLLIQNKLLSRIRRGLYLVHNFGDLEGREINMENVLPVISPGWIVGYWSAVAPEDKGAIYIVESVKNRRDEDIIGEQRYVYTSSINDVSSDKETFCKLENNYLVYDKIVALIDCILKPEYTPGEKELKEKVLENLGPLKAFLKDKKKTLIYNQSNIKKAKQYIKNITKELEQGEGGE